MRRAGWSTPLPRPLVIPELMTLRTLADVRKLLGHLPAAHRASTTWRYVADRLDEAARGAELIDLVVPLRMGCRLKASRAGWNSISATSRRKRAGSETKEAAN